MSRCMCLEMPRTGHVPVYVPGRLWPQWLHPTVCTKGPGALAVILQCMGWVGQGRRSCTKGAGALVLMSHCTVCAGWSNEIVVIYPTVDWGPVGNASLYMLGRSLPQWLCPTVCNGRAQAPSGHVQLCAPRGPGALVVSSSYVKYHRQSFRQYLAWS